MNDYSPPQKEDAADFGGEWRARFDRFAARGGSSATISGWSEHGLQRRIDEIMRACNRLRIAPGARVLDLGCGSGVYCLHFREAGYRPIGADYSIGMLGRARAVLDAVEGPQIVPLCGADLLRLPFADASFDALANVGVLQHVDDGAVALREMMRVLKPGGRAMIITLNKFSGHGVGGHVLAMLRAWRSGRLRPKKHAIRRRPATIAKIAVAAGGRVVELRGVYLFPGFLRFLERPLGRLDGLRLPGMSTPLTMPFANAFLIVIER